METENVGKKQIPGRFRPGESGNPKGKAVGTLHRATRLAQSLLDGEAEGLARKVIELALAGDITALKLCLDRICPPRRERPLSVKLPEIEGIAELPRLTAAILVAAGKGEIEPGQASALASLISSHAKALELAELEARISALEGKQ